MISNKKINETLTACCALTMKMNSRKIDSLRVKYYGCYPYCRSKLSINEGITRKHYWPNKNPS